MPNEKTHGKSRKSDRNIRLLLDCSLGKGVIFISKVTQFLFWYPWEKLFCVGILRKKKDVCAKDFFETARKTGMLGGTFPSIIKNLAGKIVFLSGKKAFYGGAVWGL